MLNRTSFELYAAHEVLDAECWDQTQEWLTCKSESRDPRVCAEQSFALLKCGQDCFERLDASCGEQLQAMAVCMEFNDTDFHTCRDQQAALATCIEQRVKPPTE